MNFPKEALGESVGHCNCEMVFTAGTGSWRSCAYTAGGWWWRSCLCSKIWTQENWETMHTTIAPCGRSQVCCIGLPSELTWIWEEKLFLLQSLSGTSLLPTGKAKIYIKYYICLYRVGKEGKISRWVAFSW